MSPVFSETTAPCRHPSAPQVAARAQWAKETSEQSVSGQNWNPVGETLPETLTSATWRRWQIAAACWVLLWASYAGSSPQMPLCKDDENET